MEQPIDFVALVDHLNSIRSSVLQPLLPWPITITADDPNPLQHYCPVQHSARPEYGSIISEVVSSIADSPALRDAANAPVHSRNFLRSPAAASPPPLPGDSLPAHILSNMQAPLSIPEISRLLSSLSLPNAENIQHAARLGSKLAAAVIAKQLALHDCRVS